MSFSVGSVCSGIEAASVAWKPFGYKFEWFSEIAQFPSNVLAERYPNVPNLGDMGLLPHYILTERITAPDVICGGTPCQAFSFAGWKNGLNDDRGNLTLKFVDIINANDIMRSKNSLSPTIALWENVEGVLSDKTNAFGCLISSLAGLQDVISCNKWPNAGAIKGPKRNVAWRVLDSKHFGLPQQRKRLYVLSGGKDFFPENCLFETYEKKLQDFPHYPLSFFKDGSRFEVFREYTDCLYSAYGTKWNGNAAAYNGSLYLVQDNRIRRFSPLECERLMGFPDNYTNITNSKRTQRYQVLGNSWAVPVIKWIGEQIIDHSIDSKPLFDSKVAYYFATVCEDGRSVYYNLGEGIVPIDRDAYINTSAVPGYSSFNLLSDVVFPTAEEAIYLSPVGCCGIIRRSSERKIAINPRLKEILVSTASQMSPEEIEKKSRIQRRGRFFESKPEFLVSLPV
jgi:DNA (cytosine-5)-methyltransferase 1